MPVTRNKENLFSIYSNQVIYILLINNIWTRYKNNNKWLHTKIVAILSPNQFGDRMATVFTYRHNINRHNQNCRHIYYFFYVVKLSLIMIIIPSVSCSQKTMVRVWGGNKDDSSYPQRRVRSKSPSARERSSEREKLATYKHNKQNTYK